MRIAALDDEPLQLEVIRRTMASIGHECHTYESGAALLRDLRRETYDMLVLDWQLPGVNGPGGGALGTLQSGTAASLSFL